jgi:hypothetical protein
MKIKSVKLFYKWYKNLTAARKQAAHFENEHLSDFGKNILWFL